MQRIDLALSQGVPTFLQVLGVVMQEMQVESAILAEELVEQNSSLYQALLVHLTQLGQFQGNTISLRYISHEAFKAQTEHSRAVIRSGELFTSCERDPIRRRNFLRYLCNLYCNLKGLIKPFPA